MEKDLVEYEIPFAGLDPGVYEYEFEVTNALLQHFGHEEIKDPQLVADVSLERMNTVMTFFFEIKGTVTMDCDRCGEAFALPISGDYKLVVKFGDDQYEETDELFVLPHSEHRINVGPFIYEYVLLSIPNRIVHPEGMCNPEVMEKLKKFERKSQDSEHDPRWDALSGLKDID